MNRLDSTGFLLVLVKGAVSALLLINDGGLHQPADMRNPLLPQLEPQPALWNDNTGSPHPAGPPLHPHGPQDHQC